MTKVNIRRLDSVTTNDTTATTLINDNFAAIQEVIENTLSRDGSTPNFMDANLDLNSHKIINAGTPTDNTDLITKEYFDQNVGNASASAAAAAASAQQAQTYATSAGNYSSVATGAADTAQAARDYIESDTNFITVSTDLAAGDNSKIKQVAANKTNIDTVAGIDSNVTTVAGIASNVTTVSSIASDVNAVAADLTNIDSVAGNATNINAVAGNSTNINAVNANKTNIDKVATDINKVKLVADDIASVNTVAVDISNVIDVAGSKTNIDTVAGISSDVSTVSGISGNVTTVAGISSNVTAVAGDLTNINAVAADLTNIDNASSYAAEAKQWAIGDPTEPTGNSAKYWAEQAASELSGLTSRVSTIEGEIPSAASSSNQLADKSYVDTADNGLQSQIDAITAASDVTDIVGTYAQLQAYDTSTLPPNSIIKVLQDESQNNETTYYRWVITGGVGSWVLIGEEGPYYTKSETNTLLSAKQDTLVSSTNIKTINSTSVLGSGDITIDSLPAQSGQSGKFLTTDGTNASWGTPTASTAWGNITGTLSNQTDLQTALNAKANVGLDNLNSTGQMIIDSQNGTISNCILDIPQNIKCSIASNVVTLASGSVLTNTGSTYSIITLTTDQTYTISNSLADGNYLLCSNGTTIQVPLGVSVTGSGASNPADGSTYSYFYNTTDKKIYAWSGSAWSDSGYCYPFAEITMVSGVASFAKDSNGNDMIFNGACFVGHHAVVYPGVRGLMVSGLNTDGSLKSKSVSSNGLQIIELPTYATSTRKIYMNNNGYTGQQLFMPAVNTPADLVQENWNYQYVKSKNIFYQYYLSTWYTQEIIDLISFSTSTTGITDFTIRQPVRLVTTEMINEIQSQVNTNTTAITGKQDTLVSGTNIKTINGSSVLGSGDITVTATAVWGSVTGTLSNQTDLQNALSAKADNSAFQVVSALPATPDADTFYFITA